MAYVHVALGAFWGHVHTAVAHIAVVCYVGLDAAMLQGALMRRRFEI